MLVLEFRGLANNKYWQEISAVAVRAHSSRDLVEYLSLGVATPDVQC